MIIWILLITGSPGYGVPMEAYRDYAQCRAEVQRIMKYGYGAPGNPNNDRVTKDNVPECVRVRLRVQP